jgi:hypothetical protein
LLQGAKHAHGENESRLFLKEKDTVVSDTRRVSQDRGCTT